VKKNPALFGRPCQVHSHQFYSTGWWHGIFIVRNQPRHMVEDKDGNLTSYGLDCYQIQFMDSPEMTSEPPEPGSGGN